MKLISIDITNWKCFKHRSISFTDELNLLHWQNGEGKTSLIECIIFCLTDKRPQGLDFESLRNDTTSSCKLELKFEHQLSEYVIEREFGASTVHRLYKDGQLISRTRADNKAILDKIIPEVIISGLWGYNSLALSPILMTDYLFDLLETEFSEILLMKKYFNQERTFRQKSITSLEKQIADQTITQKEIDQLEDQINGISSQIKEKTYVPDIQLAKARQCEEHYDEYLELKEKTERLEQKYDIYDRELCVRLAKYGLRDRDSWIDYFAGLQDELRCELAKAKNQSPLVKYPQSVIERLIEESQSINHCILCNGRRLPTEVNFRKSNSSRIQEIEQQLDDYDKYDFERLAISIKYWQLKKKLTALQYIDDIDWKKILSEYNSFVNSMYIELQKLEEELTSKKKDFSKLSDLLEHKREYSSTKECLDIIDEYIDESKEYYANSITKAASTILASINQRYTNIFIENGVYKVVVFTSDFSSSSTLAVKSLSMGEKTIVALSLILAVRKLFAPDVPLVMDEAFSNLDSNNIEAVNKVILDDSSQWILVSHDDRMLIGNVL